MHISFGTGIRVSAYSTWRNRQSLSTESGQKLLGNQRCLFLFSFTCTTPPMRDAATAMEVHITPNKRPERKKTKPVTIIQTGFEEFLELLPRTVSEGSHSGRELRENCPCHSAITSPKRVRGETLFPVRQNELESGLQAFSLQDSGRKLPCGCNMKMWKRHWSGLIQTKLMGRNFGLTTHQKSAEEITNLSGIQRALHF